MDLLCKMDKFVSVLLARTIVFQLMVLIVVFKAEASERPIAEKLTKAVDSRIPPQIAYFIPDHALNKTFLKNANGYNSFNGFSGGQPPVISMWFTNQSRKSNPKDLEAAPQHPFHFFTAPKHHKRTFNDDDDADDADTAFQSYNYQINFGKLPARIPDKKPDFKRFQSVQNTTESSVLKKVKHPKKYHIKRPITFNYANTSPNVRQRIKMVKMKHENKFEVTKNEQQSSDFKGEPSDDHNYNDNNDYDDENENYDTPNKKDRTKILKTETKSKKKSHRKKPQDSPLKLSHPMWNVENESSYNYDNGNVDENYNYPKHRHNEQCDHSSTEMTEHFDNEHNNEQDNVNTEVDFIDSPAQQKGFAIYLTKVIKHPKSKSKTKSKPKPKPTLQQIRRMSKKKPMNPNGFVPTRTLASVRRIHEVVHKPRKIQQPTLREKLTEQGGHVVYSEDGYEDEFYDHGKEDKSLEYASRTRARRSTNVKDLKGQELIDHIDILIRNVSDYLNSSEIIPDTKKKYPLYNSSDENIKVSPIKYSEYAKPVVDENISSELYESKTTECEEIDDDIDLSNAHNETSGPKKRLGKLGDRLKCLKTKLFGNKPLDNPLFHENKITQPKSDNLFTSINHESDNLQAISSVYSDVMDNIKYNRFNQNQRIFSDYGISDSYAFETINTQTRIKPVNELNTSEKYPDDIDKNSLRLKPKVTESPLIFSNPFKDPVQLPLMDISRYIPTPRYPPTASDYPMQTDFKPIVSPYGSNYKQESLTSTTNAPTTLSTTTPLYGPVRTLSTPYKKGSFHVANNLQSAQSSNLHRTVSHNVVRVLKRRRPVAVRVAAPVPSINPRH